MRKDLKIKCATVLLCLLLSTRLFAQWECRSHLAANLKPLYSSSDLRWGLELVESGGYITHAAIANSMAFFGLDYTHNSHQFYLEGGWKYWLNKDLDLDYRFTKSMFGLRELSYSYTTPDFNFRLGLHSINAADYFLVNERAWGTSIGQRLGAFHLNMSAASVTKDFARNGIFCTNGYLYDIVPSRNLSLGDQWGDTNFAAFSITRDLGAAQTTETDSASDGFDTFEPTKKTEAKGMHLKSYGGILYTEFGNYYDKAFLLGGLTGELALGKTARLKGELLYQQATENRAMIFFLQAEKEKEWASGNVSSVQLTYLGKQDWDKNAMAMPRFSNLFLGEVMRMDVIDLPLINLSLKHQFIDQQLSLKLQYSKQLQGQEMQELDFSVGKFFFKKHLRATLISGLMNSKELPSWSKLAKLELRAFF